MYYPWIKIETSDDEKCMTMTAKKEATWEQMEAWLKMSFGKDKSVEWRGFGTIGTEFQVAVIRNGNSCDDSSSEDEEKCKVCGEENVEDSDWDNGEGADNGGYLCSSCYYEKYSCDECGAHPDSSCKKSCRCDWCLETRKGDDEGDDDGECGKCGAPDCTPETCGMTGCDNDNCKKDFHESNAIRTDNGLFCCVECAN